MTDFDLRLTRRSVVVAGTVTLLQAGTVVAAEGEVITVHLDPNCGCCSGWVQHLQQAGFRANVLETRDLDAVKRTLGVPDDLAACHTAEVSGYVVEGHVPAAALKRFLAEKPQAIGLAVPGMPIGSPGMEGGKPELRPAHQLAQDERRPACGENFARLGDRAELAIATFHDNH